MVYDDYQAQVWANLQSLATPNAHTMSSIDDWDLALEGALTMLEAQMSPVDEAIKKQLIQDTDLRHAFRSLSLPLDASHTLALEPLSIRERAYAYRAVEQERASRARRFPQGGAQSCLCRSDVTGIFVAVVGALRDGLTWWAY